MPARRGGGFEDFPEISDASLDRLFVDLAAHEQHGGSGGGFSPAPGPSVPPPAYPDTRYIGSRQGEDTWRFTFIPGPVPSYITLRALATDGSVLAEQVNDLEWTREDPFNPCPGPVTTPPVVFLVGERSP